MISFSSLALFSALISLTFASPIPRRKFSFAKADADKLNYALTAELLEANYYSWGLAKWSTDDFVKAGFKEDTRTLFEEILTHEVAHAALITEALKELGEDYVRPGTYSFPVKTVDQFVRFSGVLEQIGGSAYSGLLGLFSSSEFIEHGATVLAVEARQSAYVRHLTHFSPFPAILETPLTPTQVFSLAAPLIISQPSTNPTGFIAALGIQVLPTLTVSVPDAPTKVGAKIGVHYKGYDHADKAYAIFLSEGCFFFSKVIDGHTTIPNGVASGQIYMFLSKVDTYAENDGNAITGVAVLDIAE